MTTHDVEASTEMTGRAAPTRNWAAVLIVIIGAVALAATLVHAVTQNNGVGQAMNVIVLLFSYFPGVIAVLVSAAILTFGTARLGSIVGTSRLGRVTLLLWGLLNAASQIAFIGYVTDDAGHFEAAQNIQLTLAIATVIVGLVAAVFVARAGVATGFGRVSLFIAIGLFALSEVAVASQSTIDGALWDLPRLAGLVILGLSYWRAGLPALAERPLTR